ncbi:MAG: DUF4355 domain-containing protein [Culicoidibacterales bacterium]
MKQELFKMNLQLLAEDPTQSENTEEQTEPTTPEFTEEQQAYFDAQMKQRLEEQQEASNKAFADQKRKEKEKIEAAKKEAERLATLSAEERQQAELEARVAEIEKREAELNQRAMQSEIKTQLVASELPESFMGFVYSDDADVAKTNIATLKETYEAEVNKRVQAEVEAKFKGQKGPTVNTTTKTQQRGSRISMRPLGN